MWTDTFQGAMMFGSFIVIIVKGTIDAGGMQNIFIHNYNASTIDIFK